MGKLHRTLLGLLCLWLMCFKINTANPILITVNDEAPESLYRLPTIVIPSRYDISLSLEANFGETQQFKGTVEILLQTSEIDVSTIRMHSSSINYDNANITIIGEESTVNLYSFHNLTQEYELIDIELTQPLNANVTYTFRVENYVGKLHDDMYGFYLSSYTDNEDNVQFIATTQFESTSARRAFPSFDEPNFKAVFKVTIERPVGYNSLSNTNKEQEGVQGSGPNLEVDVYLATPKMSTYLLAFIVSKFEAYPGSNSTYGVWSRAEALPTAEYSFDIGPPLLRALENYVGQDYLDTDIGKMDQVAIPDFSAGAMENWGLVTYRETGLLWDSEESTAINKQRVANVIAHEFTHMWFGNLVTMDWWKYTWLNEGFARYFQYFITAEVETTWELEKQFIIEQQQAIFGADALTGAFALSSDALTPSEISNKFGSISYSKGAAVIRMMRNFIGEENFKAGLQEYLSTHAFSNTVPNDLWESLGPHIPTEKLPPGLTIAQVMTTWTDQSGYPVVNVSLRDNAAVLTQQRFLLGTSQENNETWYVPITYTISHEPNFENTDPEYWLLPDEELVIPNILRGETGWVVVNVKESGYYRVNYDDELWIQLTAVLNSENYATIDVLNRAQIVDDSLNLARADIISYNRALEVTSFLSEETEYYPWYSAFNAFTFLRRRINPMTEVGQYLKTHIQTLMKKLYDSVNINIPANAQHIDILKTALALQWACDLDEVECINRALQLFDLFQNDEINNRLNPNIKSVIYCTATRHSTREIWDFLWNKFTETNLATEQVLIISALGCTRDVELANEYLTKSITPNSGIRRQDASSVFSAVLSGNPEGVNIAFAFLKENAEAVSENYGGMNALSSVLNGIADRITTEGQLEDLRTFVSENEEFLGEAAHQVNSAIENAEANIRWVQANEQELSGWLRERYTDSATSLTLSVSALITMVTAILINHH